MADTPWYKEGVIYSLDVETFQDSDGDGVGDLRGLTGRLDYLADLGISCLWLLPIYPSPNRDNGYDVTDHTRIDPRLGTMADFEAFMRAAGERGLRVLVDLVANHTSIDHPWFQEARRSPDSPYRDYYVWSRQRPDDARESAFPGEQDGIWTFDERAGAYYRHRFYRHQPDLNTSNPRVRDEFCRVVDLWLDRGVSGFRVDAAHFLKENDGEARIDDPEGFLRSLRRHLERRGGEAALMAEVDVPEPEIRSFFGDDDKAHMALNFLLNQSAFLALARGEAAPIADRLRSLPDLPPTGQWANFVRNHDELTLARLPEDERRVIYDAFGPDEDMRIYERGIRRRLPPMLGGDRRRIELAYSLLLTLPGTPIVRYGEEIGMGDDLRLPGRNAVRTAMQWSDGPNGGFSSADPDDLVRPVLHDDPLGFGHVNVAAQLRDPESLLNWFRRVVNLRRRCPAFGAGECTVLDLGPPEILATLHRYQGDRLLALHNLSDRPADAPLGPDLLDAGPPTDLLDDRRLDLDDGGTPRLTLSPFGYRWLRLA